MIAIILGRNKAVFQGYHCTHLQIDDYRLRLRCHVRQHLENAPCHAVVGRRFRVRPQVLPNRVDRRGMLGTDYSVENSRHDEISRAT